MFIRFYIRGIVGRYLAVNTRRWNIYFRQAIYARKYPMAGVVIVPVVVIVLAHVQTCQSQLVKMFCLIIIL